MAQLLYPVSDTSIGNWTTDGLGTTSLYATIDDPTISYVDYIQSAQTPSGDTTKYKVTSTVTDPNIGTGHSVSYSIGKSGGDLISMTVRLLQGSTVIALWHHTNVSSTPTDITQTLTSTQANAITDYTNLYLEFTANDMSYTWTDLGQDSVIAAQGTAAQRSIRDITYWNNAIWLSTSDIDTASPGPANVRYYDLSDGQFKTPSGMTGGEQSDGLLNPTILNDSLYFPFTDPTGSVDYSRVSLSFVGTRWSATVPNLEHGFMMIYYKNALYYAGGGLDGGPTWEASVYRSTDLGRSWTLVNQPQVSGANWYTCIFAQGGYLWVVGYNTANEVGPAYKSSDGITWASAGHDISPNTFAPMVAATYGGKTFLRVGPHGANSGSFVTFDGTAVGTEIGSKVFGNFNTNDLCLSADALYVLYRSKQIFRTTDGINFNLIAESPVNIESIDVYNGIIYAGTSDSHLYKAVPTHYTESSTFLTDSGGVYLIDETGYFLTGS